MTITLYELAGEDRSIRFSPHCWKSRLALAHKKLPYQTESVRFTEKSKIAFSGQKLLPVLTDDDTVVHDSWDIAMYLDKHYPNTPSLLGDDLNRAEVQAFCWWVDNELAQYVRPVVIMPIYKLIGEADKTYFRSSREQKLGMTLEAVDAMAEDKLKQLDAELQPVRETLSEKNFLGGAQPNYEDICLMGLFLWIATTSDVKFLDDNDVVYLWYKDMLKYYADAMPDSLLTF